MGKETIEQQLMDFTQETSLNTALSTLGLCHSGQEYKYVRIVRDWQRGGAETFNLIFEVGFAHHALKYMIKACTPFLPRPSIPAILEAWLTRRKLLEREGVNTPRLYGVHSGLIIENYIPYRLEDWNPREWSHNFVSQVYHFAKVLTRLEFDVNSPFSDLMTDCQYVYVVDFGEDLGNPGRLTELRDYTTEANLWLKKIGVLNYEPT